ncbi:MAG: glycosyltransferase family 2 protein [Candidatus Polarisedimenticolia bacterium]
MTTHKPTLTVVVPVYNEEPCLGALHDRLEGLRRTLWPRADVRFLFVDDGSRDGSLARLQALAERHPHAGLIGLSRNFGHQLAVTAGLDHARTDYVAILDADLQDPPEAIAPMLDLALQGHDVVYGVRRRRRGESLLKRASAAAFYRVLNRLCDIEIPIDTGDFRLLSRRVADTLRRMRERHRFLRGMVPWVGFRSIAYHYDRDERHAGRTKYPLRKMLTFAANGIMSFSSKPIVIGTRIGLLTVLAGIAGALYMLYLKIFTDVPIPGLTAVLVTLVIFGGGQLLLTGLVGEYVARIFEESKGRPLYIVAGSRNLPLEAPAASAGPPLGVPTFPAAAVRDRFPGVPTRPSRDS